MPASERAELSAELKVVASPEAECTPQEQIDTAKRVASDSGLAHEAGPEMMVLAGGRKEVLDAVRQVVETALDAGARAVEVKVGAEGEAERFGGREDVRDEG